MQRSTPNAQRQHARPPARGCGMPPAARNRSVISLRLALCALLLPCIAGAMARAALYEFTLEGVVTFSAVASNPSVGDPVTIKYVADSTDLNPSSGYGRYAASGATMVLPHATLSPVSSGFLEVGGAGIPGALSRLDYSCGIQDPQTPVGWKLDIAMAFPEGTFESDALPLELPLASGVVRRFAVIPLFTEFFRGNITAYTSVEIPEPVGTTCLIMALVLWRRTQPWAGRRLLPLPVRREGVGGGHFRLPHFLPPSPGKPVTAAASRG